MKHTIALNAPNLYAVNSLRELQAARRKTTEFEAGAEIRQQATDIVDGCRGWLDQAVLYNQSNVDHAGHDLSLVVLEKAQIPVGNGQTSWYGELTGELHLEADGRTLTSAKIQLDDTKFCYQKRGQRETFTQTDKGVSTKVVLDHGKNLLTWEY